METQNKLLINHVAKRLPYGLNFIAEDKEWQMTSVNYLDPNYPIWANNYWDEEKLKFYPEINVKDNSIGRGFSISEIKPILMPLSSLTETITIKGESFVPIEEICKMVSFYDTGLITIKKGENPICSFIDAKGFKRRLEFFRLQQEGEFYRFIWYTDDEKKEELRIDHFKIWEKLIGWHIDLPNENLIKKGLAISVFDLTENPYS